MRCAGIAPSRIQFETVRGVSVAVVLGEGSSIGSDSVDYFAQVGALGAGGLGGTEGTHGIACARYDIVTSTCGSF